MCNRNDMFQFIVYMEFIFMISVLVSIMISLHLFFYFRNIQFISIFIGAGEIRSFFIKVSYDLSNISRNIFLINSLLKLFR